MEKQELVEGVLLKKLRELRSVITTTVEQDGDDSSDEEETTCVVDEYDFTRIASSDNYRLSMIVHAIALKILYSKDINAHYYNKKTELLFGNTLMLTDEDIDTWVKNVDTWVKNRLENLIDNLVKPKSEAPKIFNLYSNFIKQDIVNHDDFNKIKALIIDFFCKNQRLLLKINSLEEESFFPWDFYELMKELLDFVQGYLKTIKINYSEEDMYVSSRDLAREIIGDYDEIIKKETEGYLERIRLTTGKKYFVSIDERRKILDRENSKPKDFFCKIILEKIESVHGAKLISNFISDYREPFFEAYLEDLFEKEVDKGYLEKIRGKTRNVSYYKILSEKKGFQEKSFFGKLESEYFNHLKEINEKLQLFDFYKKFALGIQQTKSCLGKAVRLERTILRNNFEFTNLTQLSSLVFVRLTNRSQNRLIRQKKEDARQVELNSDQVPKQKMFRSIFFPCIGAEALKIQEITSAGNRTDKIVNLGSYTEIHEQLIRLIKVLKINPKDIAVWIRKVLKNEEIVEIKTMPKPKAKELRQFLADFTGLLFFCETSRNPSSWLIHPMILDLIISDAITWEEVLVEEHMPMAISKAVSGARHIVAKWQGVMPYHYRYHGDEGKEASSIAENILKKEKRLISNWFQKFKEKNVELMTPEEIVEIVSIQAEEWYGVKTDFNFKEKIQGSFLPSFEQFSYFRIKTEKEEINLAKQSSDHCNKLDSVDVESQSKHTILNELTPLNLENKCLLNNNKSQLQTSNTSIKNQPQPVTSSNTSFTVSPSCTRELEKTKKALLVALEGCYQNDRQYSIIVIETSLAVKENDNTIACIRVPDSSQTHRQQIEFYNIYNPADDKYAFLTNETKYIHLVTSKQAEIRSTPGPGAQPKV